MSTNYAVRPELAIATLLQAGCVRENDKLEWATDTNFPIKMPDGQFVWVCLDNKRVFEFVRFGLNDPTWMIEFCQAQGRNVISEHDDEYWESY